MAVRLGFFTGNIYDSSVDPLTIKECCLLLNYKEPVLPDEPLIVRKRSELKSRCIGCNGCPQSRKGE